MLAPSMMRISRSPHRLFLALPVLLALAACSSRPEPALTIIEPKQGSAQTIPVELFAVSMRRPSEDERLRFSGERTLIPRFARVV
ncbi:MAG: hypothetical protein INF18_02745, partial [Methylobacterium sp.]|nr:hypothetical protein [Methylobacterium sp.]